MKESALTPARIKELFSYDANTGSLIRAKNAGPYKIGDVVGYKKQDGPLETKIGKHTYLIHRLVWAHQYGEWPEFSVTHIDGDFTNNHLSNLKMLVPPQSELTQERLIEILDYNQTTGLFSWKFNFGNASVGATAGCKHENGYIEIGVDGAVYKAHRLAWLYAYGVWPEAEIDHINGVRDDNRICNLREASRADNMQNKRTYKSSSSGLLGAMFHKSSGKWSAAIQVNGKRKHLGLFDTAEAAHFAYCVAKKQLHTFNPTVR